MRRSTYSDPSDVFFFFSEHTLIRGHCDHVKVQLGLTETVLSVASKQDIIRISYQSRNCGAPMLTNVKRAESRPPIFSHFLNIVKFHLQSNRPLIPKLHAILLIPGDRAYKRQRSYQLPADPPNLLVESRLHTSEKKKTKGALKALFSFVLLCLSTTQLQQCTSLLQP